MVCFLAVWCRPIQQYWAVPPQNCMWYYTFPFSSPISPVSSMGSKQWTDILPSTWTAQCASHYDHLITDAVFNISSDLMMLFLPLPLLIKAKLPLKRYVIIFELVNHWLERARLIILPRRKLVLSGVFSLGVFVVSVIRSNRWSHIWLMFSLHRFCVPSWTATTTSPLGMVVWSISTGMLGRHLLQSSSPIFPTAGHSWAVSSA